MSGKELYGRKVWIWQQDRDITKRMLFASTPGSTISAHFHVSSCGLFYT
jgi:hypothetical protein